MATILNIAGHGKKRNGTFDSGATGYIKEGEHKYYAQSFFNYLKKYEPKGHKVIYHTAYNVYDYGNLVSLARSYGKNVIVIEWHFDATGTPEAHGGHVIVYGGFTPDELDLRLRDGIKEMVGVRYNHKGHTGISGRYNLQNVNLAANNGINYRLIELGFGTSPKDSKIMLNDMDKFAKVMTEAIYKTEIKQPQQKDSMAGYYVVKSGDTLWGIGQKYNVTVAQLKKWNNLKSHVIFPNQSLKVNGSDLPAPAPEPKPKSTPKASPSNKIEKDVWVRVPANKLYATGNSNSPVKSRELSAQVDRIDNSWKNPLRLVKDGVYQGFARPSDITGGNTPAPSKPKAKSVKVGDTVTTKALYTTAQSTSNVRKSSIKGYVDSTTMGGRNPIRLRNKKGGYYLGFTRLNDII